MTSLPGGEGAVAVFDQAVTDFQANTSVPGLPLGMIADAAGLRLAFLIPAGTGLVVLAAAVGLGALRPEGPRARA